jgi:hypothetical protein
LHSTKWSDGKKKKGRKLHFLRKNSIQDSVGNEENGYPVPDPKKAMINVQQHPQKHPQKRNLARNH